MKRKMFYILLILLVFLFFYLIYGQYTYNKKGTTDHLQEELLASWTSLAKDSKMDFYKSGTSYKAHLTAGWGNKIYNDDNKTLKKDFKNPNVSLRNRNLLNLNFISNLKYQDGEYIYGKLYSPQIGRNLQCKMKIRDHKLIIRMYVGWPIIGVTKQFTKDELSEKTRNK